MSVFSIFTSKKRRRTSKRSQATPTEYYARIAGRINLLKIATLFILICFISFSFTFYGGELTMENFRYMLKFMSVDRDSTLNAGKTIRYDSDDSTLYMILNGDVAVINSQSVNVYDTAGQRLLKQNADFNDPLAAVNGKHLVVADRSSSLLSIYSAYSLLYTQEYTYPISSVATSPSGRYGVVTSALGYKSGVEIYDDDFRIIFKYYFADRYTTRLAISDDGKQAAVAAFTNDAEGSYRAYFYIFTPDSSSEPAQVFDYTDEIPLYVSFFADGSYALLTNSALRFCAPDSSIRSTVYFTGKTAKRFFAGSSYYALSFASAGLSNATTLEIYNSYGEHIMSRNVKNDVSHVDFVDDYLYYYSAGVLTAVDLKSKTEDKAHDIGIDYICLLHEPDSNSIIMFYKNTALVYNKDDFNEQQLNPPT